MTDAALVQVLPYAAVALIALVFFAVAGVEAWRSLHQSWRDRRTLKGLRS